MMVERSFVNPTPQAIYSSKTVVGLSVPMPGNMRGMLIFKNATVQDKLLGVIVVELVERMPPPKEAPCISQILTPGEIFMKQCLLESWELIQEAAVEIQLITETSILTILILQVRLTMGELEGLLGVFTQSSKDIISSSSIQSIILRMMYRKLLETTLQTTYRGTLLP
jgi:hypothetical protein